jgi:mannitol/fructose-specific phosphotransferase system IIA component (Ntr-type)/Kef-type K+ transport system membrane component KefB
MPLQTDPLLTLAILLVAGVGCGWLARLVHLPGITGQILAGVLLGPVLHVFDADAIEGLRPITHFALGLIGVTVGAHLNVKRMRNAGKRLLFLFLCEALITPLVVLLAVHAVSDMGLPWASVLAAIGVSTGSATVVTLVKETRSKGAFVKTLVGAVALNNMACILLFEAARSWVYLDLSADAGQRLGLAGFVSPLLVPLALGGVAAVGMQVVHKLVVRPDVLSTAGFLAILTTVGLAEYFGVSGLLACLFLGVVQTNLTPAREKLVDALFTNFEPAVLAIFFTLAGIELHFGHIGAVGVLAGTYFLARLVGKLSAVEIAMRLARSTDRIRRLLGIALQPQAGLAIGLVLLVQDDAMLQDQQEMLGLLLAVVLTAVMANELIGPVLTKIALSKAGEMGKDRSRLLDFIQEENIVTDLVARDKQDAITKLVDHMIRSHHLEVDRATMLSSVLEREGQASTCLGGGLAVPHATLPDGHAMVGVMGLCRAGLPFATPDGRKVHCIALFGTAKNERERHLQVLAALARTIGADPAFQDRLFNATSPGHAAEILHGEESEDFNYFLDQ